MRSVVFMDALAPPPAARALIARGSNEPLTRRMLQISRETSPDPSFELVGNGGHAA